MAVINQFITGGQHSVIYLCFVLANVARKSFWRLRKMLAKGDPNNQRFTAVDNHLMALRMSINHEYVKRVVKRVRCRPSNFIHKADQCLSHYITILNDSMTIHAINCWFYRSSRCWICWNQTIFLVKAHFLLGLPTIFPIWAWHCHKLSQSSPCSDNSSHNTSQFYRMVHRYKLVYTPIEI